jgi:nitrite reductase/ring-hydroxylating ferredoxin subunit
MGSRRLAAVDEVPVDDTLLFTITDQDSSQEIILTRLNGGITAWENHCQHWTDTRLDRGDGALVREGDIVCRRHGATFEPGSGKCTWGPCEGAYLDAIDVHVENGAVHLDEPGWEVAHRGPDDDDETDLSSGGAIRF